MSNYIQLRIKIAGPREQKKKLVEWLQPIAEEEGLDFDMSEEVHDWQEDRFLIKLKGSMRSGDGDSLFKKLIGWGMAMPGRDLNIRYVDERENFNHLRKRVIKDGKHVVDSSERRDKPKAKTKKKARKKSAR